MRTFPEFARYVRGRLGGRRDAMHRRLAEYLGVHPSQISAYKEGQSPSLIRCIQIARFFGDEPESVVALVGKEQEWDELRALLGEVLRGELKVIGEEGSGGWQVPVVGNAEAGDVDLRYGYTDQGFPPGAADDYITLSADLSEPNTYGLVIRGQSMEPLFRDGDQVLVSPTRPFIPKRLYVVRGVDGRVWLKRVERHGDTYSLLSVNPAYPPIYLHTRDVEWLHAVTWVRFSRT